MAEYQLYCFAQSGNSYRAALMLNLIGADWEPVWVDFFAKGEQRTPEFRASTGIRGTRSLWSGTAISSRHCTSCSSAGA